MSERAVFLDRDGTINKEVQYLGDEQRLELIGGAAEGIHLLNEAGYQVVVLTNQAGVARGYFSEKTVERIHQRLQKVLQEDGAWLDAVYYCPHHPTEGTSSYQVDCDCRKPKPGLLVRAAKDLNIDLRQSYVVGDKLSDLEAGYAAGCQGVLVRTGYGKETEEQFRAHGLKPDYIAEDLRAACQWIISQNEKHANKAPGHQRV